jgi:hypothetical protein
MELKNDGFIDLVLRLRICSNFIYANALRLIRHRVVLLSVYSVAQGGGIALYHTHHSRAVVCLVKWLFKG